MIALPFPSDSVRQALRHGVVIPAHPLALDRDRRLDERSQERLTRYYCAAGVGGLAVGVHTTQFEIRDPKHRLLGPVLELAIRTVREISQERGKESVMIAGVVGDRTQAVSEGKMAQELGYDAGLLSLAGLGDRSDDELIDHARAVAAEIPLFGFYLQPSVGGRPLSRNFWRQFCQIENVVGIKVAPFNRYATLDVVHGLIESGRSQEIPLYTGNDDTILQDLLTTYTIPTPEGDRSVNVAGGLLGHWAVWTSAAVRLLEACRRWRASGSIPTAALTLAAQVTDMNAALFDAAHGYAGCIPGINEVLRRQGLIETGETLNPDASLSPGQSEELDRVIRSYPDLVDARFVEKFLEGEA